MQQYLLNKSTAPRFHIITFSQNSRMYAGTSILLKTLGLFGVVVRSVTNLYRGAFLIDACLGF